MDTIKSSELRADKRDKMIGEPTGLTEGGKQRRL